MWETLESLKIYIFTFFQCAPRCSVQVIVFWACSGVFNHRSNYCMLEYLSTRDMMTYNVYVCHLVWSDLCACYMRQKVQTFTCPLQAFFQSLYFPVILTVNLCAPICRSLSPFPSGFCLQRQKQHMPVSPQFYKRLFSLIIKHILSSS